MSLEASIFASVMLHEELEGRTGETDSEADEDDGWTPLLAVLIIYTLLIMLF